MDRVWQDGRAQKNVQTPESPARRCWPELVSEERKAQSPAPELPLSGLERSGGAAAGRRRSPSVPLSFPETLTCEVLLVMCTGWVLGSCEGHSHISIVKENRKEQKPNMAEGLRAAAKGSCAVFSKENSASSARRRHGNVFWIERPMAARGPDSPFLSVQFWWGGGGAVAACRALVAKGWGGGRVAWCPAWVG